MSLLILFAGASSGAAPEQPTVSTTGIAAIQAPMLIIAAAGK
jgi:hypothetical protein